MTAEDVAEFKAALAELPGPVLAYCRSGTRCRLLWQYANG
jgi:sulfide:quinone oxidoreductase